MRHGNTNNLIPGGGHTPEKRRENARKAGIASGRSRRLKAIAESLLNMPMEKGRPLANLAKIQTIPEAKDANLTVGQRVCLEVVLKALDGDLRAVTWLRDTVDGKPPKRQTVITYIDPEPDPYGGITTEDLREMAKEIKAREQAERKEP